MTKTYFFIFAVFNEQFSENYLVNENNNCCDVENAKVISGKKLRKKKTIFFKYS